MTARRRTWLTRLGLAVALLLLAAGALVARYAADRAEHHRLRAAEVGRAPVVGPKRVVPATATAAAPSRSSCLTGVVHDHGAPVGGMQVSVSDSPPTLSGDCPCVRTGLSCRCREGLALLPTLPSAGLVEAVSSVTTDGSGRFSLCGLQGDGLRLVWAEHPDGRLAAPASEESALVRPGASLVLEVVPLLAVRGVVLANLTPVPGATVQAYSTPPYFTHTFTTDARGRFETRLPQATSDFAVSAQGFEAQWLEQHVSPQQVLVLQLGGQSTLTVRALFEDRPVAGAEVKVTDESPVLTDAQGLARFSLPVAPRVQVRVSKGELIGSSTVGLLEGLPQRVDVALVKGVRARGMVVDELGAPRAARVRGLSAGKPLRSDEAGRFTSEVLLPSKDIYPVAVVEGCADSDSHALPVGEVDLELTLTVACGEMVNGVVLDAAGTPVKNATAFLDSVDHREAATTDETGTFRFHQPKGTYQLKVSHERYRTYEQPLQVPAKDVTVVLDAGGSLSGRVLDRGGTGVPGASITVVPAVLDELLAELEGGNTRGTTDAEGRFEVPGLLAGRLVVSATADSQGTVVSDVLVLQPGEHRGGLVLTLDERVDLTGTVTDEQRRPIPGATVRWEPADEKSALMGVLLDAVRGRVDEVLRFLPSPSVTDLDGRYVLKGLPVSKVKLRVMAAGYATVEQVASRKDTVDLVLKREGGRVRGRVLDEAGRPLTRFQVDGTAFTPDDGRFEVRAYSREDTLSVTAAGFTRQSVKVTLDVPEKDLGDVVMKQGRQLRLEVVTSTGAPLEGVKVAVAQAVDGDTCTSRADGRCEVGSLLDVQTSVKAVKEGYAPTAATVAPGQVDQPLRLTMMPAAGRITGEAFALPGRPAAARAVFLSGDVSKSVMTDGEGRFTAEGLPEGAYCVSLDSRGVRGLEWAVPVRASATPAPVQVGPAAGGGVLVGARTLPGRLVLVRGAAQPMALSELLDRSAASLCESLTTSVIITVTTGDFRVEGVPPGRWSVFFVSLTQVDEKGSLPPTVLELGANETKTVP